MAEIEEAKLNTKIGFDITEAENKIARLKKQLSQINSQLKSKEIDNSIATILEKKASKLESTMNQIRNIVDIEKNIKNLSTQVNNSFRGVDGKFKSAAEHVAEIGANWKRISTYMKAVYAQTAGVDNIYSQMVYKGRMLRLMFGTKPGQANQDLNMALKQMELKFRAENADLIIKNKAITQADNKTKMEKRVADSQKTAEQLENEKLIAQQEKLQKRLGTTQLQVMSNYWVINRLANGYKALLNYTVQYDEELHQLQAISAMSNASLDKTRQTIEAVAVSTEFTSLELAKASTVLAQAGLSATQIQSTLPAIAKLATATGTDLATATDTITSTMNIYNLQLSEAERVTNALTTAMNESKATIPGFQTTIQYAGNFAAQLGMSFEETAAAISAATQAGIRSKSMLGTGLRAVLTEFLKPTKKLIDQLQSVGLTVEDIDVKTKGYVNVLKTLKAAGFGAAEAFRGMERRGAAFLAAQLNQTDFMDNLRLQMAGSAAASKANETQMEALAKQIKNFQNVLGTAGTKGLTPFIKLLSQMLRIVNELSQTKLGGGIFSLLLTGGGTFATVKSFEMTFGSLKAIFKGLEMLTGHGSASKYFKLLDAFSSLKGSTVSNWGKLGAHLKIIMNLMGPAGWLTIGAAAISLIYQLGDALDLWTSKNELIMRQLEEAKGKSGEIQDTITVLDQYLGKIISNGEKLESLTERRIIATEIITRVPEAAQYLNGLTDSVEDLTKALIKLKGLKLNEKAEQIREVARASYAAVIEGSGTDIEAKTNVLGLWNNSEEGVFNLMSDWIKLRQGAKNYTGYDLPSFVELFGDEKSAEGAIRLAPKQAAEKMAEAINEWRDSLLANVKTEDDVHRIMQQVQAASLGLKVLMNTSKNNMEAINNKLEEIKVEKAAAVWNDFGDNIAEMNSRVEKAIKDFDNSYTKPFKGMEEKNNKFDSKFIEKLDTDASALLATQNDFHSIMNFDALLETKEGQKQLREALERSGHLTNEQLKKLNDKDNLRGLASELSKSDLPEWLERLGTKITFAVKLAASAGHNIPDMNLVQLEENLSKYENKIGKASTQAEADHWAKSAINTVRQMEALTKAEKTKELNKLVGPDGKQALEAINQPIVDNLNKAILEIPKDAQTKIDEINKMAKRATDTFTRGANRIDPLTLEINKFFNALDEGIKKISTTYREAIKPLEEQLARQEGVISATSQYYGSNNPLVTYEQNRKKRMEEGQNSAYIAALEERLNALEGQRQALRENKIGKTNIYEEAAKYQETFKRYQELTASGNYGEALKLQKQLDKVSAAAKKVATKDDELTKDINETKEELEKRRTWRDQMESYSNLSTMEQIGKGVWAPMSNYMENTKEQGLHTLAGSAAYLSSGVIDEIDSGFTTMFRDIISNSKSAGDAFKAFGRQVLETIRDIAIQMSVRQGLSAIFSKFMSQSPELAVGETQGNLTRLSATGGLVNGPVKNRDSVNMKLMPGEYVLKKSAVDVIGRDYLDSLNTNAAATLNASAVSVDEARGEGSSNSNSGGGTVNVYVVGQEQQQAMTPSDVLVTITQDMLTGGQTKRLVKSIAMGAL